MSMQSPVYGDLHPINYSTTTLFITKIGHIFKKDEYSVTGSDGTLLFSVTKSKSNRLVLRDPKGNPILTIYKPWKWFSKDEYKILNGDSKDEANLAWTAVESSMFQISSILDVFVGANTARKPSDFKIKQKLFSESYYFHRGDSEDVIAKMKAINKLQNILKMKDTYRLEIFQNIDHSFIVSLVVIIDMLEETKRRRHASSSGATSSSC